MPARTLDDCGHDVVTDYERIEGILFGYCELCHQDVQQTDDEDENGMPGVGAD